MPGQTVYKLAAIVPQRQMHEYFWIGPFKLTRSGWTAAVLKGEGASAAQISASSCINVHLQRKGGGEGAGQCLSWTRQITLWFFTKCVLKKIKRRYICFGLSSEEVVVYKNRVCRHVYLFLKNRDSFLTASHLVKCKPKNVCPVNHNKSRWFNTLLSIFSSC